MVSLAASTAAAPKPGTASDCATVLTFAPAPTQAFVSSTKTLTVAEPATPTLPAPLPPTVMLTMSSHDTALTTTPRTVSVCRVPPPSLVPVNTVAASRLASAVTVAPSPMYAWVGFAVTTVELLTPTALLPKPIPPAPTPILTSSIACTTTLPSANTSLPAPMYASVVLSVTWTAMDPATPCPADTARPSVAEMISTVEVAFTSTLPPSERTSESAT